MDLPSNDAFVDLADHVFLPADEYKLLAATALLGAVAVGGVVFYAGYKTSQKIADALARKITKKPIQN